MATTATSTTTTSPWASMRAVVVESYGKPSHEHIKLTTVPVPSLSNSTDVLIRVMSAALNPIDGMIVRGEAEKLIPVTFPHPLGFDVAGVIEKVGTGVTSFKQGDRVYARVDHDRMGTLADYCLTSVTSIAHMPHNVSFDEAASVPLVALTALQSLRNVGGLKPGQKLLLLGGTGGVGTAAIQIAKILQAGEITVTAGSHFNRCLELGANKVIDYKTEKWSETVKDQDLIFDTIGEANSSFSCLKSGGTTVSILGTILPSALKEAGLEISVATQAWLTAAAAPTQANALAHNVHYKYCWMKPSGADLAEVARWIEAGRMKPVIDRVYPIQEIGQAFDHLETGHAKGKIVIHLADK